MVVIISLVVNTLMEDNAMISFLLTCAKSLEEAFPEDF
jgi:hypothetical protein